MARTDVTVSRRRGAALVSRVLLLTASAIAVGCGIGFLLITYFGTVVEDVFPAVWSDGAWDGMWRAGIGVAAIVIYASLGLISVTQVWSRLSFTRQMVSDSEQNSEWMPPLADRVDATRDVPFTGVWLFAIYSFVFVGFAVMAGFFMLGDGAARSSGYLLIGASLGYAALIVAILVVVARVASPLWDNAVARAREMWPRAVAGPRTDDRKRVALGAQARGLQLFARRGAVIAGIGAAVSSGTFLVVLFARKPCRRCDTRFFDANGELSIDILLTVSGAVALIGMVAVVIVLLAGWSSLVVDSFLLRGIATSSPRRNRPAGALIGQIDGLWWGTMAGVVLIGGGWGAAPIIAVAESVAPGSWPLWLMPSLLATGMTGVVVVTWAEFASVRTRNLFHTAWPEEVRVS